jgi:hypothetical protein
MLFDDVKSIEKFYKEYAHDTYFSIRIGQQFSRNDIRSKGKCKRVLVHEDKKQKEEEFCTTEMHIMQRCWP